MAQDNVRLEEVVHDGEEEGNEGIADEITMAVNAKIEQKMKQMESRSEVTIKEAIKRALDRKSVTSTSKKYKKDPDFKREGNKKRYEVNDEILEKIEGAVEAIDNKELAKAKEDLESGKKLILKQQKLIRIADREDNGWEVVRHYVSDELASDSDDEKALKKAKKEALASIAKRKLKKSREHFRSYQDRSRSRLQYTKPEQGGPIMEGGTADRATIVKQGMSEESPPSVINATRRDTFRTFAPLISITDDGDHHKFDYSQNQNCCVKFSLRNHIDFWENHLKPSSFVLNVLRYGYLLPFTRMPTPFYAENNKSALRYPDFVKGAIEKLLDNKFIEEISSPAFCCNPLTVSDKGKLRLVLDLRHVNTFISVKKFRYEDLKYVAELFEDEDYFVTFDLASGYHHIDIHEAHHKYLGLHWNFDGAGRYFRFTVLAFGLSPASYVFSKVLRPLTKRWRGQGMKTIVFLDDGISARKTEAMAAQAGKEIEADLLQAGFSINREKTDLKPRQRGKWLGMIIDTRTMRFYVPGVKIDRLKRCLIATLSRDTVTTKELAQLAGTLSSMYLAIGPLVRFFTRNIYREITWATSWYQRLRITQDTKDDLHFWIKNIDHINGCSFKHRPATTQMVFTDASEDGYGGFTVHKLQKLICAGKFDRYAREQSSTFRELLAVKLVLQSYGNILFETIVTN